jgi:chromosome segregation ATPase
MARNDPSSELLAAAAAVEAEISRFEDATAAFEKLSLSSQKNLEKATKALNALADGEQRVVEQVQALLRTINPIRDRVQVQVEHIRAKAEELQKRTVAFQSLEQELGALGEAAAAVSANLKETSGAPVALDAELAGLVSRAKALEERARADDFDDLVRLADGLRQQLIVVRAKLKRLIDASPSA